MIAKPLPGESTKHDSEERPRVSVIIPAWNAEKFISDAIASVLKQTFSEFELIIVDDYSTDNTFEIINSFKDYRIRATRHHRNLGVSEARNTGIKIARADYIALLDSDDMAHPNRLNIQVATLDWDPSVAMVGSYVSLINESGEQLNRIWRQPLDSDEIAINLLFRNSCFTSTLMLRRVCCMDYFSSDLKVSEDYEFNTRVAMTGKIRNIDAPLARYRIRDYGLTGRHNQLMLELNNKIAATYMAHIGFYPSDREIQLNAFIGSPRPNHSPRLLDEIEEWLIKLAETNDRKSIFNKTLFCLYTDTKLLECIICITFPPSAVKDAITTVPSKTAFTGSSFGATRSIPK
jgi:glycosyltransferase involved in cell wall biosynthesis